MDVFSLQFVSALGAIVVIDLVLAGDNAIVIGLAARRLPPPLRTRAIVWGTAGAVFVRTVMTVAVVWLLRIPGLMAVGGALLVWIAYRLLLDSNADGEHHVRPAAGFWTAMQTIVVADALMGLDNVLAVAGAAHGSVLLVVAGLLISVPIMIWASQLILKYVERYPAIVYFGAGVLAWTAVKMLLSEPLLARYTPDSETASVLVYMTVIAGTLLGGFLANHRDIAKRINKRLVMLLATPAATDRSVATRRGDSPMKKILLPVDGSANSLKAVRYAVNRFLNGEELEFHLLHVREPFSQHIARFVRRRDRIASHREHAERALEPARRLLAQFNIAPCFHAELGKRGATIVRVAERLGAAEIVIGTARKNSITRILEDSTTYQVLNTSPVPVQIVPGDSVSPLERYGAAAALAAVLALLIAAME
jgi:YjbE family integral membrane protein